MGYWKEVGIRKYSDFSKLSPKKIERGLKEMYSLMLSQLPTGMTLKQAKVEVKKAVKLCKKEAKKEGDNLPNCGNLMFQAAELGVPSAKRRIEEARKEGATDEDIREYWNLHYLQRRMVIWSENVFRLANFISFQEDHGLTPEVARDKTKKMFPIYGDPKDIRDFHVSYDDRPLPNELRSRVDIYREKHGAEVILKKVSKYSSFNAFVRVEIKKGKL